MLQFVKIDKVEKNLKVENHENWLNLKVLW